MIREGPPSRAAAAGRARSGALLALLVAAACAPTHPEPSAGPPPAVPSPAARGVPAEAPPAPVDSVAGAPDRARPPGPVAAPPAWRDAATGPRPPAPADAPPATISILAPASPLPAGLLARARAVPADPAAPPAPLPASWRSGDGSVLRVGADGVLVGAAPGRTTLRATTAEATAEVEVEVVPDAARVLHVDPPESFPVAGEVVHLTASAWTGEGTELADARVAWSAAPFGEGPAVRVEEDGAFVAPSSGAWRVTATRGGLAASAVVHASARPVAAGLAPLGAGAPPPEGGPIAGVRAFEGRDGHDWAWTWTLPPSRIHLWDVTDPARPILVRSLDPGGPVAELEVDAAARWAAVALSGSGEGGDGGGVLVYDLSAPDAPRPLATAAGALAGGVVALAVEGSTAWAAPRTGGGLVALDLSDPSRPRPIGAWTADASASPVADLAVRDGLAWVARWHDGLAILDVGAGIRDGTPARPVLVAEHRYRTRLDGRSWGNTLRAVPWRDRVLLADGIASCASCATGPRGGVHVVDVTDLVNPRAAAWYRPPEAGAREVRIDAERELLVGAFAEGGLRVVDLSGELRGDLAAQEREAARAGTGPADPRVRSMAWGVDLLKDVALVADLYGGLRIYRIEAAAETPREPTGADLPD